MLRTAAITFSLLVCGCSDSLTAHNLTSRNLTLMAIDDGGTGTGRATGVGGRGTLEVQLAGKTFSGTWVAAQGGSVGFGSAGRTTFSAISVDSGSTGSALLAASDGSTLRCRFVYGGMSRAGYGECQDNAGKRYELQIS